MTGTKLKTRFFYTDYVLHMIRFYLSTPDGLNLQERVYTSASIANWTAVQMVFRRLDPIEVDLMRKVFAVDHYLPKAVAVYCKNTGTDTNEVWKVIARVNEKIAKVRGLL